jgi:hypothetical protein
VGTGIALGAIGFRFHDPGFSVSANEKRAEQELGSLNHVPF